MKHIRGVVFDWAGTIVDHGSIAPVIAFVEVFRQHGVAVDVPTARAPMGSNKRDHIKAILAAPHVAVAWEAAHGGVASSEADVDALYAAFTPIQVETVKTRARGIPGAFKVIESLRAAGVRVGGCSGYNDAIMDALRVAAAGQEDGITVDAVACANAAGTNGRPKPWMSVRVAEALDAWPLRACVKVDDTPVGIGEGLNAGMWTVGVIASGNELGLDEDELAALSPDALAARLAAGKERMLAAGAHYAVDSVNELWPVLIEIDGRLAKGEAPPLPPVAPRSS